MPWFEGSGRNPHGVSLRLMTPVSRREFTMSLVGGVAAGAAFGGEASAGLQQAGGAAAPSAGGAKSDALAAISLSEASARIQARSVTAVELVNACLGRIDALQPEGERVHHRDARGRPRTGEDARRRAARRQAARPSSRDSDCAQGQHRHRRRADHRRERGVRRSRARGGRPGRQPAGGSRRHRRRQGEPPRVRVRRHVGDQLFRPGAQSLGARSQSGRVVRRFRGSGRRRPLLRGARHRHRRLHPHPGLVLQRRRLETDLRPRADPRHHPAGGLARSLRADHPNGARCRDDAERDGGLRPAGHHQPRASRRGLRQGAGAACHRLSRRRGARPVLRHARRRHRLGRGRRPQGAGDTDEVVADRHDAAVHPRRERRRRDLRLSRGSLREAAGPLHDSDSPFAAERRQRQGGRLRARTLAARAAPPHHRRRVPEGRCGGAADAPAFATHGGRGDQARRNRHPAEPRAREHPAVQRLRHSRRSRFRAASRQRDCRWG